MAHRRKQCFLKMCDCAPTPGMFFIQKNGHKVTTTNCWENANEKCQRISKIDNNMYDGKKKWQMLDARNIFNILRSV